MSMYYGINKTLITVKKFYKNFLKTSAKLKICVLYIVRGKVQQKPLFGRDKKWGQELPKWGVATVVVAEEQAKGLRLSQQEKMRRILRKGVPFP